VRKGVPPPDLRCWQLQGEGPERVTGNNPALVPSWERSDYSEKEGPHGGSFCLASDARTDREELAVELCDQLLVVREASSLAQALEASKASEDDLTHDSSPFRRVEELDHRREANDHPEETCDRKEQEKTAKHVKSPFKGTGER